MALLVIDTSTDQPAVGILPESGLPGAAPHLTGRRHGRDLLPSIRDLLSRQELEVNDLRVVAVGLGPGSYTGLRIGLTAARMLAYITGADLVGFDSLQGWAHEAPAEACRVHVVADAQRGDVYAADFHRTAPGEPIAAIAPSRIESLAAWSGRLVEPGLVLGPGLESPAIRNAVPPRLATFQLPADHSRAFALLRMARELWQAGRRDDLWTLEPNYLRRSAAEDLWEARGPKP
jgi:tRNA threonylcarbamoyladenosine biosynthesis protein TsaB